MSTLQSLLACCQAVVGGGSVDLDLHSEREWTGIVDQGRRHGLIPLLHKCLRGSRHVPPAIAEQLRRESIGAVAENLLQLRGLKTAADAFTRHNIPWLCLKGPVAGMYYSDPSLRPFSDIDLIIRPSDFQAAYLSLVELGFRPSFDMGLKWQAWHFRQRSELALDRDGSTLDLHSELLPHVYSFAPDMEGIWARADTQNIFGVSGCTPGLCDTLVYLCLHAAKHDWERLIWLLDIAVLVTRKSDLLDWEVIAGDLKGGSRSIPLRVSLLLAESLGAKLPSRISQLVKDQEVVGLSDACVRLWQREPTPMSPWPWNRLYYHSMKRPTDRLRYWREAILRPTPLEWMAIPLPFSCRAVYYAFRPIRLVWKFLKPTKAYQ
jgi:Uncharacterised nucleotidyltransferase